MAEILRSNAIRSVSQGVPPRTPEDATPRLEKDGIIKESKKNILNKVMKGFPKSSDPKLRRRVGEITKPKGDY